MGRVWGRYVDPGGNGRYRLRFPLLYVCRQLLHPGTWTGLVVGTTHLEASLRMVMADENLGQSVSRAPETGA